LGKEGHFEEGKKEKKKNIKASHCQVQAERSMVQQTSPQGRKGHMSEAQNFVQSTSSISYIMSGCILEPRWSGVTHCEKSDRPSELISC
jgi:hypothetical protein